MADAGPPSPGGPARKCLKIAGVEVHFPHGKKPFPQQLALMAKALAAMNSCENALIESPTGTGKTLALLSCALSWQIAKYKEDVENRKRIAAQEKEEEEDGESDSTAANGKAKTNEKMGPDLTDFRYDSAADTTAQCTCVPQALNFTPGKSRFFPATPQKLGGLEVDDRSSQDTQPANDESQSGSDDDSLDFESPRSKKRQKRASTCPIHGVDVALGNKENSTMSKPAPSRKPNEKQQQEEQDESGNGAAKRPIPQARKTVIFFASRTHSQLSQVANELKRCPSVLTGTTRMTILGSRMQYCINPTILRKKKLASSGARNEECHKLLSAKGAGCKFYKNNCGTLDTKVNGQIWDIEDIVETGKRERMCPYFGSRTLATERRATLVLCPYNYLIDPIVRSAMGIDTLIEGSVIIIDEAHNIDDVSRQASSMESSQSTILEALTQLEFVANHSSLEKKEAVTLLQQTVQKLADLIEFLCESPLMKSDGKVLLNGPEALVHLYDRCGVNETTVPMLRKLFKEACKNDDAKTTSSGANLTVEDAVQLGPAAKNVLESFLSVMEFMLSEGKRFARDFKILIEPVKSQQRRLGGSAPTSDFSFCMWCLNAKVAFQSLADRCRSIILTSGTLSPLASFASDLGVPFKFSLETSHVIDASRQLWAGVVSHGIDPSTNCPVKLECTYGNKDNLSYLHALGSTMSSFLQHVPNGSLCFFPSYSYMKQAISYWKECGVWTALQRSKPLILVEGSEGNKEEFERNMERFRNAVKSPEGALFFCVCRGKLSEGIDFSDASARAVFIIGIPYPSSKDLKVRLKREYQDQALARVSHSARNDEGKPLSGREWYSQQAFRALNQAIGRCIRHKNDFGAVIFMDHRFSQKQVISNLSKWMRGWLCFPSTNQVALDSMQAFFEYHRKSSLSAPAIVKCLESHIEKTGGGVDNIATSSISDKEPGRQEEVVHIDLDEDDHMLVEESAPESKVDDENVDSDSESKSDKSHGRLNQNLWELELEEEEEINETPGEDIVIIDDDNNTTREELEKQQILKDLVQTTLVSIRKHSHSQEAQKYLANSLITELKREYSMDEF